MSALTSERARVQLREAQLYVSQLNDAIALNAAEVEEARGRVGLLDCEPNRETLAKAQEARAKLLDDLENASAGVRLANHLRDQAVARENAAARAIAYTEALALREIGEALRDEIAAAIDESQAWLADLDRKAKEYEDAASELRTRGASPGLRVYALSGYPQQWSGISAGLSRLRPLYARPGS
jgi:hypothetical protein